MSYNKELETNRDAKRQHDNNLKKAAAERLAKISKNKQQKRKEKAND